MPPEPLWKRQLEWFILTKYVCFHESWFSMNNWWNKVIKVVFSRRHINQTLSRASFFASHVGNSSLVQANRTTRLRRISAPQYLLNQRPATPFCQLFRSHDTCIFCALYSFAWGGILEVREANYAVVDAWIPQSTKLDDLETSTNFGSAFFCPG